jgi:hypothetical protein
MLLDERNEDDQRIAQCVLDCGGAPPLFRPISENRIPQSARRKFNRFIESPLLYSNVPTDHEPKSGGVPENEEITTIAPRSSLAPQREEGLRVRSRKSLKIRTLHFSSAEGRHIRRLPGKAVPEIPQSSTVNLKISACCPFSPGRSSG